MKSKRKNLGWLAFLSLLVWLYFDYTNQIRRAITTGWISVILTLAHIWIK
jgi:hypothetical protein